MKNYHYRTNYERQYRILCSECGINPPFVLEAWSDYTLLSQMNVLLAKLGCVLFDKEELEMELV